MEMELAGNTDLLEKRETAIREFLAETGLAAAERCKLSGDASFRNYERIKHGGKSFVLMDAPPPKEDVRPFVNVACFLENNGFSAPHIIAKNEENGFLLLEDLGDDLYSSILSIKPAPHLEEEIYGKAVDALTELHKTPLLDNLSPYDDARLLREAALFTDWYLPYAEIELSESLKEEYAEILLELFANLKKQKPVVVLRDYHAENLIYLPKREAHKKVGLLDFQDAVIGSPAYDLVSLLEDARRDVSPKLQKKIYNYYLASNPKIDKELFALCYAILGAQRNLKIIGIFTRLAVRDEKRRYLYFLPRVWKHLDADLEKPELLPLKNWLRKILPAGRMRHENR